METPLHSRIIAYIEKYQPVTYAQLEARALERGYKLFDFEEAIQRVHKDKRIRVSAELFYTYAPPVVASPNPHLDWLRDNYPMMTTENDGSGIEADFSYLFLTPEQLLEYKAKAKGMPVHMLKNGQGRMLQSKQWQAEKIKSRPQFLSTSKSKVSSAGATTTGLSMTRSLALTERILGLKG